VCDATRTISVPLLPGTNLQPWMMLEMKYQTPVMLTCSVTDLGPELGWVSTSLRTRMYQGKAAKDRVGCVRTASNKIRCWRRPLRSPQKRSGYAQRSTARGRGTRKQSLPSRKPRTFRDSLTVRI
jgi:hypothetical protein